jgi:predicted Zn-dependent protease
MSSAGPRSSGIGLHISVIPLLIGLIAVAVYYYSNSQKGVFGRRQVLTLNEQQENQLGKQTFDKILDEEGTHVVPDGPLVESVRHIGERLAEAAQKPEVLSRLKLKPRKFNWDFKVIRSQQVNAFCLPGGKVVVYTGIVPVAETEAGLATVMGHEIGHALARHGNERISQDELLRIGETALAASIHDEDPDRQRQIIALIGAGGHYGFELPFSREHELEADHIGLLLMAAAGYDPHEAIEFWGRMEQKGGGKTPEFMSTHPGHEHRAQALKDLLPEASALYEASPHQKTNRRLAQP